MVSDDPDAFASALEAALNDEGTDLLDGDHVGVDDDEALGASGVDSCRSDAVVC